jgi:hypothetical protein
MPITVQPEYSSRNNKNQFRFEPFPRRPLQTIPGIYGSILPEQDLFALSQPKKKSGFLSKLVKGTALVGAAVLGGLAFKRYAPNVAIQVAGYIPDIVKQPVNYAAQTGIGQRVGYYGESLLTHSEGWLGQLKNLASGWFRKGVQ